MGPMSILVLAIISCVGFGIYHLDESRRFSMTEDARGGVYVLDRKTASINYCDERACRLIGNGSLPSQAVGDPALLAMTRNSVMGAPAVAPLRQEGQVPQGMLPNLARTGATVETLTQAQPVAAVPLSKGSEKPTLPKPAKNTAVADGTDGAGDSADSDDTDTADDGGDSSADGTGSDANATNTDASDDSDGAADTGDDSDTAA